MTITRMTVETKIITKTKPVSEEAGVEIEAEEVEVDMIVEVAVGMTVVVEEDMIGLLLVIL